MGRPPRPAGGRASLEGKIARACGLLDDFPLTSLRPPSRLTGLLFLACAGAWAGSIPFLELIPPLQKRACAGRSPAIRGPAHWLRANRAQVAIPCIPAGKSGFHDTIWAKSTSSDSRLLHGGRQSPISAEGLLARWRDAGLCASWRRCSFAVARCGSGT